ncbi:hypothetical protein MBLNU230_g3175t1 [Neophaeotheca triangularis]
MSPKRKAVKGVGAIEKKAQHNDDADETTGRIVTATATKKSFVKAASKTAAMRARLPRAAKNVSAGANTAAARNSSIATKKAAEGKTVKSKDAGSKVSKPKAEKQDIPKAASAAKPKDVAASKRSRAASKGASKLKAEGKIETAAAIKQKSKASSTARTKSTSPDKKSDVSKVDSKPTSPKKAKGGSMTNTSKTSPSKGDPLSFLTPNRLNINPSITTNTIKKFDPATIAADAKATTIIIHSRFPKLLESFLAHKRTMGSTYEQAFYGRPNGFTWQDLVTRLVTKRPLVFMGGNDFTVLRDGSKLKNSKAEWDRNGTMEQDQNATLTLEEYLSYDEIMLASLVGVSGPSHFINDGNRNNSGKPGKPGTFETRGVIVGLVGARFERPDRMDSVHMLPTVKNPKQDSCLSEIFQQWLGPGLVKSEKPGLDVDMYKARMRITIDILLMEADRRAAGDGRQAYTYVVGLGLGVWQRSAQQPQYYIEAFTQALEELSLPRIGTLEFAYISVAKATIDAVTLAAKTQGIKAVFSKRNPAEKINTDQLLVLSYAWDGNSFPGNEYWNGSLTASGDPAAACMSTIAELHNPYTNPYADRIQILENKKQKTSPTKPTPLPPPQK